LLSKRRDICSRKNGSLPGNPAARRSKGNHLDGYAASHQAVAKLEGSWHAVAARVRPVQQVFE
jgi:hypothetical protein